MPRSPGFSVWFACVALTGACDGANDAPVRPRNELLRSLGYAEQEAEEPRR